MARPRRVGGELPRSLETRLLMAIRPMVDDYRKAARQVSSVRDALSAGAAIRRRWPDSRLRQIVKDVASDVLAHTERVWRTLSRRRDHMDAPDGDALVRQWIEDMVGMVQSLRDEAAAGMARDIARAVEAGTDLDKVKRKWIRSGIPVSFGTVEGRVKVIAQHQISTLNARIQAGRASAIGVKEFVWRTQGDDRVRDAHQSLNGRTFSYTSPPAEGLPGTPINCRCWAESVVPDELVEGIGIESAFG